MELAEVSINRWMYKVVYVHNVVYIHNAVYTHNVVHVHNVVYVHNGVLFGHKEWNPVTCNKMDRTTGCCVKWCKADVERWALWFFLLCVEAMPVELRIDEWLLENGKWCSHRG